MGAVTDRISRRLSFFFFFDALATASIFDSVDEVTDPYKDVNVGQPGRFAALSTFSLPSQAS